jgi:heptosyltransferase III
LVLFFSAFTKLWDLVTNRRIESLLPGDDVLVVKLSALGDTFILLPVFKALKEKIGPQGKIRMIATPINQAALKGFPYIDEVLVLDFGKLSKSPGALFGFLKQLRSFEPALALDFDQWLRISPLLCFLSKAPLRFGFKTSGQRRHFLYQRTVENNSERHEFEQFASIAALAGVDRACMDNFNGFLEREKLYRGTSTKTPDTKPLVLIHPGCGSYGWQRAWPEKYYAQLIRRLGPDIRVQMTGMGTYEENLIASIMKDTGTDIENRSGKLEIEQLADLLREADLVVCGNTGVLHLATGLGRPTVTMNGPANPVKWGPLGPVLDKNGKAQEHSGEVSLLLADIFCSPCTTLGFEYGCKFRPCMESIAVEKVYQECVRLLKK